MSVLLPAPIFTQQGMHLAAALTEIHFIQRADVGEFLDDALHFNDIYIAHLTTAISRFIVLRLRVRSPMNSL